MFVLKRVKKLYFEFEAHIHRKKLKYGSIYFLILVIFEFTLVSQLNAPVLTIALCVVLPCDCFDKYLYSKIKVSNSGESGMLDTLWEIYSSTVSRMKT